MKGRFLIFSVVLIIIVVAELVVYFVYKQNTAQPLTTTQISASPFPTISATPSLVGPNDEENNDGTLVRSRLEHYYEGRIIEVVDAPFTEDWRGKAYRYVGKITLDNKYSDSVGNVHILEESKDRLEIFDKQGQSIGSSLNVLRPNQEVGVTMLYDMLKPWPDRLVKVTVQLL